MFTSAHLAFNMSCERQIAEVFFLLCVQGISTMHISDSKQKHTFVRILLATSSLLTCYVHGIPASFYKIVSMLPHVCFLLLRKLTNIYYHIVGFEGA